MFRQVWRAFLGGEKAVSQQKCWWGDNDLNERFDVCWIFGGIVQSGALSFFMIDFRVTLEFHWLSLSLWKFVATLDLFSGKPVFKISNTCSCDHLICSLNSLCQANCTQSINRIPAGAKNVLKSVYPAFTGYTDLPKCSEKFPRFSDLFHFPKYLLFRILLCHMNVPKINRKKWHGNPVIILKILLFFHL